MSRRVWIGCAAHMRPHSSKSRRKSSHWSFVRRSTSLAKWSAPSTPTIFSIEFSAASASGNKLPLRNFTACLDHRPHILKCRQVGERVALHHQQIGPFSSGEHSAIVEANRFG